MEDKRKFCEFRAKYRKKDLENLLMTINTDQVKRNPKIFNSLKKIFTNLANEQSIYDKEIYTLVNRARPKNVFNDEFISIFEEAIEKKLQLKLLYQKTNSKRIYLVNPLGILLGMRTYFIAATGITYKSIRKFIVSRILTLELSETPVNIEFDFNLKKYQKLIWCF